MRKYMLAISLAAAVLLAGCAPGKPWPLGSADPPKTTTPHTVLMVGDSLLGGVDWSLSNVLNKRGFAVTVIDAHVNGSGVVSPLTAPDGTKYASTLDWMRANLARYPQTDTVVIEYGGACSSCDIWATWSFGYGSTAFMTAWQQRATDMINAVKATGRKVLYTISPGVNVSGTTIVSGSTLRADTALALTKMDRTVLCPLANGCVDWWDPSVDTKDNYQQWLAYDNANWQIRLDDQVHWAADGSRRASRWTSSDFDRFWASQPQPFAAAPAIPGTGGLIEAGDPVRLNPMNRP